MAVSVSHDKATILKLLQSVLLDVATDHVAKLELCSADSIQT